MQADELRKSFTLDATKWQYTHGVRDLERISPDNWVGDAALLARPGNHEIQLALFYDYGSNPARYPQWQAFFRERQPLPSSCGARTTSSFRQRARILIAAT
jgi:hypothetical protein